MGAGSRTATPATPAYALYGGIHNKRDWICNPATRNAWHSASNDNLAADDATSGNGTSPNCSIPGKWHRRPLCRKYRTDCRMRGMDAPFGKTNIVPRPDSEKLVKIETKNRSCWDLFCGYVCCSFPAYRLKMYVQGYARYLDCRARLTTARYN